MLRRIFFAIVITMLLISASVAQDDAQSRELQQENSSGSQHNGVPGRVAIIKILKSLAGGEIDVQEAAARLSRVGETAIEVLHEKINSGERQISDGALKVLNSLIYLFIQQLADEDFETRDRAFRMLFAIGEPVIPHLEELAKSRSESARFFARRLKQMIEYGVSPDLYEKIGTILSGYDALGWRDRMTAISDIERLAGGEALPCIRRIFLREESALVRVHAANSLLRVSGWSLEMLKFIRDAGVVKELRVPAITYEVYISQGLKYVEAERYAEAVEEFKKALKDFPRDFRANYHIALAYLHLKEYALSVNHFKVCVEEEPENSNAHYNLACAYSLQANVDDAIRHLALAIKYGYDDLAHMEKDADLDNIRNDPRYGELARQLSEKGQKR